MRFSIQEMKKQIQRRNGELYLRLHLLHPGELSSELKKLMSYHEQHLNQPQKAFSQDEARACIGDYRLADCLIATLSTWYSWTAPTWNPTPVLVQAEIHSPVALRLALFDYVNEHHQGFLDSETRLQALQHVADLYQMSIDELEYRLVLNSENEAILVRNGPSPTSQELATLYNQYAFEAALFNSSSVHFVIDCNAFQQSSISSKATIGTGVGAVIKRLCYLARRMGVYYDLAYDPLATPAAPRLQLTLYGPEDVTGLPQQYGPRLANLCRILLGYGISTAGKNRSHPALLGAIVEAEASVHFLQRAYHFVIDSALLTLLPPPPVADATTSNEMGQTSSDLLFDSSIEQSFAEAFAALERSNAVDGWQLTREPEPLLSEQGIFIPDFVLTRAHRHIYMEILGFWTPAYRERKIQKLRQLRDQQDIVLAISVEAREAFASIRKDFPIVWYDGQLSATELLTILRKHYDDLAERLSSLDKAAIRQRVIDEGFLAERLCYALLNCYRRSELQQAVALIVDKEVAYLSGFGLYARSWMERLESSFVEWIDDQQPLLLSDVVQESRRCWPELENCEDSGIEAMLDLWPTVHVQHSSIFAATVTVGTDLSRPVADEDFLPVSTRPVQRRSESKKKQVRERRTGEETTQGDLWS